ncbi:GGDEF domain-containing protein [Planctomicrobium sp.]|nr:diguanylate cyclase [Planctomicrobium sp.]MDB4439364.1 GGDEF domain-containing protein [Planctomicrobium sp.]
MRERQAKLVFDTEESVECRRFLHNQCIADVLDVIDLNDHRYLIVEDKQGSLLGIVETEDLLQKATSADPVERRRWCEMPLEAAISARLDTFSPERTPNDFSTLNSLKDINATTISSSDEDLAALFLNDDLYLRWSSIKQILHHALVDTVTNLPNRMVFERRLTEEWQRLQRNSNSLCILFIDLDYFKKINDEFGHGAGDLVLKEVGSTLQNQLRSYDLLVRYGGDEFAAILTGCSAAQLAIPIQRIQEGLRDLSIQGFDSLPKLSLSIGAVIIRSQCDVPSVSELVRAADVCLYEAKENGRGCAYISDLTSQSSKPQLIEGEHVSIASKK